MTVTLPLSPASRRRVGRAALGALLAVGLLAGCAQEEPVGDPGPTTTAPAPTTPAPTDDAPTTEDPATTTEDATSTNADPAPTTQAPTDDAAVTSAGPQADPTLAAADKGFTVEVPEGWEDAIDLVDVPSVQLAMKAPEQVDGFFTNVLVTKEEYVANLTSAVEQAAKELAGNDKDAEYELLELAPVDGNRAPGYTITRTVQGKTLVQTQRWISHDGTLYVVTMSALEAQAKDAQETLDALLESWTWTD